MYGITLISETFNERSLVASMEDLWSLPFLIALYLLPANPNQWVYFVSLSPPICIPFVFVDRLFCRELLLAYCRTRKMILLVHPLIDGLTAEYVTLDIPILYRYGAHPHYHRFSVDAYSQVGWCSRNAGAVASRTVNASLYNMFVLRLAPPRHAR